MSDINKDELSSLEAINLTDLKIISTSGTPSDCVVICGNKQLKGIKSIRFELDKSALVGKVYIEAFVKEMFIDAKSIETEIKEVVE